MLHTVDRATTVANHLLSLSRVAQLGRDGELGAVAIAACVRDAIIELSPLISAKRLEFSLDGEGFDAAGDAVMLGELVRNLLGNAIHHSPAGARGGVVLRTAPCKEVIVWDEGPGVDDALKPRLFTPFGAGRGGVGLGLSICQQVAAAMGAQVHLYNRVEDGRVCGVDAVVRWAAPAP
jgi:two-component system sensor histidine kinase TctE